MPTLGKTLLGTLDAGLQGLKRVLSVSEQNVLTMTPSTISSPFWAGHIDGLELSNNGTDADHDIDIATGVCSMRDGSGNRKLFELTSGLTKQIDANWAEGTDAGGFPSGLTLSADTTYHVFLIGKDDGSVDAGFDTDTSASNLLSDASNYSWFRRTGSVVTSTSSNIYNFVQTGDHFLFEGIKEDYNVSNPGTSASLRAITVPSGIKVRALHTFSIRDGAPNRQIAGLCTSPDQADQAPSAQLNNIRTSDIDDIAGASQASIYKEVRTRSSDGAIRTRVDTSDSNVTIRGFTEGWIDDRGRNA